MPKMRIRNKALFVTMLIMLIAVTVAVVSAFRITIDIRGTNRNTEYIEITIPQGAGLAQISNILHDENIINHPRIFRFYTGRQNNVVFQQGSHSVRRNMSYSELIEVLGMIPGFSLPEGTERVVIPEGFELRHIADRLYSRGLIDRTRFMHEIEHGNFDFDFVRAIPTTHGRIHRLEGYLFPATYDIQPHYSEWDIINLMLQTFERIVIPAYEEYVNSRLESYANMLNDRRIFIQSLDEIVIMASIVEREAVNDAERPTIAGVFRNRIRIGMLLQSCATVKYTFELGERPAVLSIAQTRIDTPYNTYMHAGLPVGPIASPGLASIRAAMDWESHDYLFFTANIAGTGHIFSRTLAEHNAASRERERAHRTQ